MHKIWQQNHYNADTGVIKDEFVIGPIYRLVLTVIQNVKHTSGISTVLLKLIHPRDRKKSAYDIEIEPCP